MTPNPKENKLKPGPSEESGGSGDDQQATGSGEEYDDEEIDVSLDGTVNLPMFVNQVTRPWGSSRFRLRLGQFVSGFAQFGPGCDRATQ